MTVFVALLGEDAPDAVVRVHSLEMSNFRFLHAADIHLDSPLRGLEGHDRQIADRIRSAPRAALENLVQRAVGDRVHFVVIAGDLYDGSWKDYRTGLFFAEQMSRLREAEIPVFLLYGNHDAESQITKPLQLPENVKVFPSRSPGTFTLYDHGVALHGQSFKTRAVTEDLVPDYPSPRSGLFNIGVLHTGLGGMDGHDDYAPCTVPELAAKGYDYWALGHIHRRQILQERPWIVFPGNLQGRHARETGPKGAFLVSVNGGEVEAASPVNLDVVRFTVLAVAVPGADTMDEVVEAVRGAAGAAAAEAEGRLLVCRVRLTGRSPIHSQLVSENDHLLAEARSATLGLGDEMVWIERILVETKPPMDPAALARRKDALGDLLRMLREAPHDTALVDDLKSDVGVLATRLPHEVGEGVEEAALRAALDGDTTALIQETAPYLLARLTAEDS